MSVDWDAMVLGPAMAVFGGGAHCEPAAGAPFDLTDAVFDAGHTEVTIEDGGDPISTTGPVLGVRLAACPIELKQGDKVTITDPLAGPCFNRAYIVADVRPDSHGWAKLMLNEAA